MQSPGVYLLFEKNAWILKELVINQFVSSTNSKKFRCIYTLFVTCARSICLRIQHRDLYNRSHDCSCGLIGSTYESLVFFFLMKQYDSRTLLITATHFLRGKNEWHQKNISNKCDSSRITYVSSLEWHQRQLLYDLDWKCNYSPVSRPPAYACGVQVAHVGVRDCPQSIWWIQ